jgi:hypothetical protein
MHEVENVSPPAFEERQARPWGRVVGHGRRPRWREKQCTVESGDVVTREDRETWDEGGVERLVVEVSGCCPNGRSESGLRMTRSKSALTCGQRR